MLSFRVLVNFVPGAIRGFHPLLFVPRRLPGDRVPRRAGAASSCSRGARLGTTSSGGKSTRKGSERGAERKALSAAVRALGPKAEAAALALSDFWAEAGVASGERLFGMLPSHAVIAIAEGRTGKKPLERLNRPLAGLASVALHDAIVPLAQQCVVCHEEWEVVVDRCEGFIQLAQSFPSPEAVKDLLFVLLELYETARHCTANGYIVQHVQDKTYKPEVRRELEEELQTRLTDLFWRLSTDVLKILIQHKADVSEHRGEDTVQQGTPPKPSSGSER